MLLHSPCCNSRVGIFSHGILKTSIHAIIAMGLKFSFMWCVMNACVTSQSVCYKFFIGAKSDQLGKHKCQSERTNTSLKVHIKLLQSSLMALLPSLCNFQSYFSTPTVGQDKEYGFWQKKADQQRDCLWHRQKKGIEKGLEMDSMNKGGRDKGWCVE